MKVKEKGKPLDIEKLIANWNTRYPVDKWYRKKYGIGFGSEEHKKLNFIFMAIEYKEEALIKRTERLAAEREGEDFFNSNLPGAEAIGQNQGLQKVKPMTKKEIDKEFENLDISQFNKPIENTNIS